MGLKFSCLKGEFWGGYCGFFHFVLGLLLSLVFSSSVKASGGWLYLEEI